ncbi:MAG TPA: biotin/lipoyl-binding protein, partial [Terriglobales bacterium]|nr:biotin/lipoyl-binding protein [Terriglobales bacterium]
MSTDTRHKDLAGLRIDRAALEEESSGSSWSRMYIIGGVVFIALLGLGTLAYRYLFTPDPEVEVVRAAAEGGNIAGSVVLTATGYIVPHHQINVNSKVTGRVKWIGDEKGDKVKEGQVLVRLEDEEFRAQYNQARGAADSARAYYEELQ